MPITIPEECMAPAVACDVCRLLEGNSSPKPCTYCSLCDAHICGACFRNWPRRIRAAVLRRLEPGYKGQPDYAETLMKEGTRPSQS